METPEFDLFKRIENLEEKFEGELTVKDAFILGAIGFEIAYAALSFQSPQNARKFKDEFLGRVKQAGLSHKWLDILQEDLLSVCNNIEQTGETK